ncbi:hypothetical protein SAMN05216579_1978 [Pseudomonas granadensis]|nr:hypothetical protein SAMN05216579_1978 [Pseudomonas granadensis]
MERLDGLALSRAGSLLQLDWVGAVWDWLGLRALSLASQLPQGLGLGSGRWVGWWIAIASRLTPTLGLGWGSLGLGGCGGAIAGWPAPTGIGVGQWEMGWLVDSYREQAHSYNWIGSVWDWLGLRALSLAGQLPQGLGLGSGRWVGWWMAIASRLIPTIGLGWGSLGLGGCGGAIAGWPTPTGIGVGPWEVGWLVGSYREQAHSYNWIGLGQFGIGWLCGRYRWRASSHRDWGVGGMVSSGRRRRPGVRCI